MPAAATTPAPCWQSPHGRALPAPGPRTLVMGVLNVTPDSFSDGGQLPTPAAVVRRAGEMLAAGADVLDVGGESTRPDSAPVSVAEELARVRPALAALREAFPQAAISIDSYKPEVARAGVEAGADIINDVWGALHGFTSAQRVAAMAAMEGGGELPMISAMAETAASLRCPLILMHNRPDKNYGDFWPDMLGDLRLSLALAQAAGVPRHQLWLDPGFGFAKDPPHNLEVVKNLRHVIALGYPVLLGVSRKSTIGRVLDNAPATDRLEGTAAADVWGIQQGCHMVRVHDVAALNRYHRFADALKAGLDWTP